MNGNYKPELCSDLFDFILWHYPSIGCRPNEY
jgi:hypothetical protein